MKRVVLAVALLLGTLAAAYGYGVSRREATYSELLRVGDAAAASGDLVAAVEAFSGAIALKPGSMAAYLKRGEAYRHRDELETALRDLRQAADLDPTAPRPRELLGDVSYATGRYQRAAERYREYIALDDSSYRLFYKLGLAQYRAGQPSACVTALTSAIQLEPGSGENHYLLGLCLRDAQRLKEALVALERAVALAPAMVQAREELAAVYGRLGRQDDRITQLLALLALDPGPSREVALGLAYAAADDSQSAVQTLGRAARRYPTHRYTYVALGRVWLDIAQASADPAAGAAADPVALGKALEALQNAMGAEENAEALMLSGRALLLASDLEAAERMLLRATEKLPAEPLAFFHLAEAAERLGHADVARAALIDYDSLAPIAAGSRRGSGVALRIAELSARLNDPESASVWYQRAAGGTPDPTLLVRMAEAYSLAGNEEAARDSLARALSLDPHHPAALALKRRLR